MKVFKSEKCCFKIQREYLDDICFYNASNDIGEIGVLVKDEYNEYVFTTNIILSPDNFSEAIEILKDKSIDWKEDFEVITT